MQIKGKLLDKLRCDFCAELLSYSPILINDEGKNMCGRCIPSKTKTGTFVKNLIYEEIAAFVQFPCINSNNGCCAMVKLENAKYHEENCPFRKRNDSNQKPELECPLSITNECSWSGSKCEFELHCKNKHLNTIIDHPYCKKPNLNRDSESYFILKMFEHLFILQVKCSLSENTLWHNVQFLGPSNLAHLFEYNLEFKKGKSRLAENQNIKPYNPSVDIKSNGIRNKITNLINLLGSYDDINVEISIDIRTETCVRCSNVINAFPLFPSNEEGKYFCITCNEILSFMNINNTELSDSKTNSISIKKVIEIKTPKEMKKEREDMEMMHLFRNIMDNGLYFEEGRPGPSGVSAPPVVSFESFACTNIENGCQFASSDEKLIDRHENWLCTVGNLCLICFDEFWPETRITHLENHHADYSRLAINSYPIAKIICKNTLPLSNCQLAMKNCHGKNFIAIFEFLKDTNVLFIISSAESTNNLFSFRFRIFDTLNDFSVNGDMIRIKNDNEQLYWFTEFPKFSDHNNIFNFVVTVKKWELD